MRARVRAPSDFLFLVIGDKSKFRMANLVRLSQRISIYQYSSVNVGTGHGNKYLHALFRSLANECWSTLQLIYI